MHDAQAFRRDRAALSGPGVSVRVVPVRSRRDRWDFAALPEEIYASDSNWIATGKTAMRAAMDPARNPFHREAHTEHFVARDRRGKCVGRVSATIHPDHMRRHGPAAFFGHFECTNSAEVGQHLLAAVEAWAEERGIAVVRGPCSYAMTQEAGLQVDGFEEPAVALQPYNPPYYAELLHAAGYRPAFHMSTFMVSRESKAVGQAMRNGDRVVSQLGLSVRTLSMSRFWQDLEQIRLCYNRAFEAHPQTVGISRAVFTEQARELKSIVDPRLLRMLEANGRTLAFTVGIPNVNEVLRGTRGKLTLGLLLRFKRLLAQVQSLVVVMVGADPLLAERQRAAGGPAYGVGSALAAQVAHCLSEQGYRVVHTTWIHDANWRALALMRAIGAEPRKRYAVFQKGEGFAGGQADLPAPHTFLPTSGPPPSC